MLINMMDVLQHLLGTAGIVNLRSQQAVRWPEH